jgi:hypothetical protein
MASITLKVRVPRVKKGPQMSLDVLVRSPAWVSQTFDPERCKRYSARAWFQAERHGGTIALSSVNLELVAHECLHAAWSILGSRPDEEELADMTGKLTAKVWKALS